MADDKSDMRQAIKEGLFVPLDDKTVLLYQFGCTLSGEKDGLPEGIEVYIEIRMINGTPHCIEAKFRSTREDQGVPAKVIRDFRLEDRIEYVCAMMALRFDSEREAKEGHGWWNDFSGRSTLPPVRKARRNAREGYPDEMLREVAEVYQANQNRHPTKAVREAFGIAQSTAHLYVKKARERGFLAQLLPNKGSDQ